jgi:1-acyl-sn-glycerol-3-phosphate acyltransferase
VVVLVDAALGTESYCLMDAENLERLPFFGWIGAVSLRRLEPRLALADLKQHAELLDRPGRVVWIFPQGKQRPAHLRPLELQRGVSVLATASGARVLPLSLSYAFRERAEPAVVLTFGAPCEVARRGPLEALERGLVLGLEKNDRFVTEGEGSYRAIVPPQGPQQVPWAGRLVARLGGGHHA